jgi:hypothetical protein
MGRGYSPIAAPLFLSRCRNRFADLRNVSFAILGLGELAGTGITPAMIMRLTGIGSQYIGTFVDAKVEYFDGSKTHKVKLPHNIPAEKFWSLTLYNN